MREPLLGSPNLLFPRNLGKCTVSAYLTAIYMGYKKNLYRVFKKLLRAVRSSHEEGSDQ